jgi:hypothetical protein
MIYFRFIGIIIVVMTIVSCVQTGAKNKNIQIINRKKLQNEVNSKKLSDAELKALEDADLWVPEENSLPKN